jgi:hypothetical protein
LTNHSCHIYKDVNLHQHCLTYFMTHSFHKLSFGYKSAYWYRSIGYIQEEYLKDLFCSACDCVQGHMKVSAEFCFFLYFAGSVCGWGVHTCTHAHFVHVYMHYLVCVHACVTDRNNLSWRCLRTGSWGWYLGLIGRK